jgi:hypothetical protein
MVGLTDVGSELIIVWTCFKRSAYDKSVLATVLLKIMASELDVKFKFKKLYLQYADVRLV